MSSHRFSPNSVDDLRASNHSRRLYTYHEPVQDIADWYDGPALIEMWCAEWEGAGWEVVVLGRPMAEAHPRWPWYSSAVSIFPTQNSPQYEAACFHRWLAMAAVGGGFLADADVLPSSSQMPGWVPRHLLNRSQLLVHSVDFLENGAACPCFVQGTVAGYEAACEAFVAAGAAKSGAPHVSDQELLRGGSIDLDIRPDVLTVGAPGAPKAPAVHYKTTALTRFSGTKSERIVRARLEGCTV